MRNYNEIKEIIDWSKKFFASQGFCVVCGHDDPLDLEFHHIGRKRNDEFVISLCRNCHGRISRQQRWWPKESLFRDNSKTLRDAFVVFGFSQVFKEQARKIFAKHGVDYL